MHRRNVICLVILVCPAASFLLDNADTHLDVKIDLQHPVASLGSKYIGATIDTNFFMHGRVTSLNLSDPKIQAVTKAFAPSYIRIGGTAADALVFNATLRGKASNAVGPDTFEGLARFLNMTGWELIFDLNVLIRKDGHWDPSNARELLQYLSQHDFDVPCFQLGNEPNIYPDKYHTTVTPQSLADDYKRLKTVLAEFPRYRDSCILGPEVTRITYSNTKDYFLQFMQAGGGQALSGIGVHHYICHPPVREDFFTKVYSMEAMKEELEMVKAIAKPYAPHLPIWLTETGTTFASCHGHSDLRLTYINGFMWLDKLGLSALYGVKNLNREEFFMNLVDRQTFDPTPDYYLTLLYKRLVQGRVFKVPTSTKTVRVYAHCTNPQSYPRGAITIYAINLETVEMTLTFSQFPGQQLDLYLLTPGDGPGILSSKTTALNGKQLLMPGSELPPMPPKTVQENSIRMAPRSFGFVVIPHANVPGCQQ